MQLINSQMKWAKVFLISFFLFILILPSIAITDKAFGETYSVIDLGSYYNE